jgi:hypothetical protein
VGGGFSSDMIKWVHQEHGVRVINEAPGVMVFETDPEYVLCSSSVASLQLAVHSEQFERCCSIARGDDV